MSDFKKVKVSDLVRQLEEESDKRIQELGEGKATLIVNFGNKARREEFKNLINHRDSLTKMIMTVCEYYENKIQKLTQKES